MREIGLLPIHAGIFAAKRTLDKIGVILHGYEVRPDGILTLQLEERDCERACHSLRRDGFTLAVFQFERD